jgi:23S rRNA (pseudouridine1915-N3)-methyltransferase
MKVSLIMVGKTDFAFVEEGEALYADRISRYVLFEKIVIKDIKNRKALDASQIKKNEGVEILSKMQPGDYVVLLDDKGREFNSISFANYMEAKLNTTSKRMVFVIGGAYGFSEEVYQRANEKISLSKMTFSHQIIRVIFLEQLYRAFSILKGEPYHHE